MAMENIFKLNQQTEMLKERNIQNELESFVEKHGNFTGSEIEDLFRQIPQDLDINVKSLLENTIDFLKKSKKTKLGKADLRKLYRKVRTEQLEASKTLEDDEISVDLADCEVILNPRRGIYTQQIINEMLIPVDVYCWEKLDVLCKYMIDYCDSKPEELYDIEFQQNPESELLKKSQMTYNEIKQLLNDQCYRGVNSGNKNMLNAVLKLYLDMAPSKQEKNIRKIVDKSIINKILIQEFIPCEIYQQNPFYFIKETQNWYRYTDIHCYEIVCEDNILADLQNWMVERDILTSKTILTDALLNLRLQFQKSVNDFINPYYMVLKNGLYDLRENKLKDFSPKKLTTRYIPRTYIANVKERPEIWEKLLEIFDYGKGDHPEQSLSKVWVGENGVLYTTDRQLWEQYCVNMVHFHFADRLIMILVGQPSAGKSPMVDTIHGMMGDNVCSAVNLVTCGDKGGLDKVSALKEIWTNQEMNMGDASNETMQLHKSIQSKDPRYNLRFLFSDTAEFRGNKFEFGATNQAFRMTGAYNKGASFKRICPLMCPNVYDKNTEFESLIRNEQFLDELFSYLINQPVKQVNDGWNELEFQNRNMQIWNWSAYPVSRVCADLYVRSYEDNSEIETMNVFREVETRLRQQTREIPKKMNALIKTALGEMGVDFKRNKTGDKFVGIKRKMDLDKSIQIPRRKRTAISKKNRWKSSPL
ncbi:MAG: hypothetical protein ACTSWL_01190 [Promethearchaeota archaeon]